MNISEGRDQQVLSQVSLAAGEELLDLHRDPYHHRSVLTLAGGAAAVESAAQAVARCAVATIDLRAHHGAHPRFGVVDVVPFVADPTDGAPTGGLALEARRRFAVWAASELELPVFLYGPPAPGSTEPEAPDGGAPSHERSLPEVRRRAFVDLSPDLGPPDPRLHAGSVAVGARPPLVAYNVWVARGDIEMARAVAASVRGPAIRALGLVVGDRLQVSCNLTDPFHTGPADAYDRIASALADAGGAAGPGELVGLLPAAVLAAVPAHRHRVLGISTDATLERRLERQLRTR